MEIQQFHSQNKYNGRNGFLPDMIVCHITEGSFDGAVSWLCNSESQVSSHFLVGKDARVAQFVKIEDSSWCNGTTKKQDDKRCYENSISKIVRERKTNANYYTITIEHEAFSKDGGALTDIQLEKTVELIKYIQKQVKNMYNIEIPFDREHIVGHYEINPITKPNCPGEKFPFDEIIKKLNTKEIENYSCDIVEKEEEGVIVEKSNFVINGEIYAINRILFENFNYIKIADLAKAGFEIKYDEETNVPTIKTP